VYGLRKKELGIGTAGIADDRSAAGARNLPDACDRTGPVRAIWIVVAAVYAPALPMVHRAQSHRTAPTGASAYRAQARILPIASPPTDAQILQFALEGEPPCSPRS
jgi:hypothetical protein